MKIGIICSHGGHLTEILYLIKAFDGHEIFFITYSNPRTVVLPFRKYLFPNFGSKPYLMPFHIPRMLKILSREHPDVLFSNGAEIAIPLFYASRLFRIPTIFVETYTRITLPTITGRIVYPVTDLFLVLWPELLHKYGRKATFHGEMFQVADRSGTVEHTNKKHIFVVVGMHTQGFERLIRKMDEIAPKLKMKVIMQIGNTSYTPKNADYFRFKDSDEDVKRLITDAALVICQGAMIVIDSLFSGTPVLAVPRQEKYHEHIDDHQVLFVKKLKERGFIESYSEDLSDLEDNLNNIHPQKAIHVSTNPELLDSIKHYLVQISTH